MMPNLFQYPICVYAILKANLIVENINPLFTERELEIQLRDSQSKAIITLDTFAQVLSKIKKNTAIEHVVVTTMGEIGRASCRERV